MTTLGTRYPTLAFISGGVGEAEDGIPPQPFETFCYDSALMQAKIENFNIIPYTSVLPKELYNNIVPVDSVASSFKHGAVLFIIGSNQRVIHYDRSFYSPARFLRTFCRPFKVYIADCTNRSLYNFVCLGII